VFHLRPAPGPWTAAAASAADGAPGVAWLSDEAVIVPDAGEAPLTEPPLVRKPPIVARPASGYESGIAEQRRRSNAVAVELAYEAAAAAAESDVERALDPTAALAAATALLLGLALLRFAVAWALAFAWWLAVIGGVLLDARRGRRFKTRPTLSKIGRRETSTSVERQPLPR